MTNLWLEVVDIKDQPIESAVILVDGRDENVATIPMFTAKDGKIQIPLEDGKHEIEVHIEGLFPGMSFTINTPYYELITLRLFYGDRGQ